MGEKGVCKLLYFLHFDFNLHISILVTSCSNGFGCGIAMLVNSYRRLYWLFFCLCCMCMSPLLAAISKHGLAPLYVYSCIGFSLYVQALLFLNVRAEKFFLVMSWFLDYRVLHCWHDCRYPSKH